MTRVREVTADDFSTLIHENDIVFLDFWATWCAPCKHFSGIFEKVANQYQQVVFAKINIEKEKDFADTFQIRSIPHLMVFKQGIAIYSEAGSIPESTLKELVEQSLTVDMTQVKEEIEKDK